MINLVKLAETKQKNDVDPTACLVRSLHQTVSLLHTVDISAAAG